MYFQYCIEKQANLASILGLHEQIDIRESLNQRFPNVQHWIGLSSIPNNSKKRTPKNYFWMDVNSDFLFFRHDANMTENCVYMLDIEHDYRWLDANCLENQKKALCKLIL